MRRRWWIVAVAGGAVVVGIALAFRRDPLEIEKAELAKAGLPTTRQQIHATGPQTGSDAGPYYKQYKALWSKPLVKSADDIYNRAMYDGSLSVAEKDKLVLQLRPYIAPAIQGSKADRLVLIDANGDRTADIGGNGMDLLSRLAEADGRLGRIDEALSELTAADRMNMQVWQNPDFTLAFYGLSHEYDPVLRSFQSVMQADADNPITLNKGLAFLGSLPPVPALRDRLAGECCSLLLDFEKSETISKWHDGDTEITPMDRIKDRLWYRARVRKWQAFEIRMRREALTQLRDDADWQTAHDTYQHVLGANKNGPFLAGDSGYMPVVLDLLDTWGMDLARRRVEMAAVRIQLSRLRTGAAPKGLPDSGEDSIDPFTGKKLLYRVEGSGFTVYSVGRNRVDNAGSRKGDIVAGF